MIIISVELWPANNPMQRKVLGIGTIANDGTGTPAIGHYKVAFRDVQHQRIEARVENFERKEGGLELLRQALNAALDNPVPESVDSE